MKSYFQGVSSEMKKVVWPTGSQATKETLTVIFLSIIFGLFLGGSDFILTKLISFIIGL